MIDEIQLEMNLIMRVLRREPNLIKSKIDIAKPFGYMSSDAALAIYNTYGMRAKDIYLLCYTHGLYLDLEGLLCKIQDQKEQDKKMVQCNA